MLNEIKSILHQHLHFNTDLVTTEMINFIANELMGMVLCNVQCETIKVSQLHWTRKGLDSWHEYELIECDKAVYFYKGEKITDASFDDNSIDPVYYDIYTVKGNKTQHYQLSGRTTVIKISIETNKNNN